MTNRKATAAAIIAALTMSSALPGATVAPEGTRRAGKRVAAGGYHTCAVRAGGGLRCWGNNSGGQLGDGTLLDRLTPVVTVGITNAIAVAAGAFHTCVLTAGGNVRCFGSNMGGQLGNSTLTLQSTPTTVAGLTNVVQIAAGGYHTCAVLISGEVRCWGINPFGQLGDGVASAGLTAQPVPVTVIKDDGTPLTGVVEVTAGQSRSCALTNTGAVYCWGLMEIDNSGWLPVPLLSFTAKPIAVPGDQILLNAGLNHVCSVRASRELRCWGDNSSGQLGDGTLIQRRNPVLSSSGALNLTGLATGGWHTCLLRANAAVQCWGSNSAGQLGDGTLVDRTTPGTAVVLGAVMPLEVSAGIDHTCALLADDRVRCWGSNGYGQLGDGTKISRTTAVTALDAGLANGRLVSNGAEHTCAIRASGKPDCWGANTAGQLGDGTNIGRVTPNAALPVTGLANIAQIASGKQYACALDAAGVVKCWGVNAVGQLGNGTTTNSLTPVTVTGVTEAVTISVSEEHACAVKAGGTVACWGSNASGQLGDGTTANRSAAVTVSGGALNNAVMVASGQFHTCALRGGGTVQCWGANSYGQLGDGTTTQRLTPVNVTGLASTAVSISAGQYHTCARLMGGAVQCWGANFEAQLGDGTTTDRLAPTTVSGLANAVTVTANGEFSCALLADGTAKCWGDNYHGQLGDGTTTDRLTPAVVSGLANAASLGAASDNLVNMSNCALQASGIPFCWGNNTGGKLGDGTTTNRSLPTAVLTF